MKNLAIIPARGGSKRIPHKNIRPFLGQPIMAYPIEAAKQSGLFDHIMVSTDDPHIADIAQQYGAEVPFFRSAATANDYAGLADVLLEVIHQYDLLGDMPQNVCCILATAPLISSQDLINAYQHLSDGSCDMVYPIVPFSYPVLRSVVQNEDGYVQMKWPEYYNSRSQDLETFYHDSGTFYWITTDQLLKNKRLTTSRTKGLIVDDLSVQDIDNETDWKLAEMKYQLLHGHL